MSSHLPRHECEADIRKKYFDFFSKESDEHLLKCIRSPAFNNEERYANVEWKWYRREARLEAQRRGLSV